MSVTGQGNLSRWSRAAAGVVLLAASGVATLASTQDTQPVTPAVKPAAAAPAVPGKKATAKKAPAKKGPKTQTGAETCAPNRTFVPANKGAAGVCAPPASAQAGQKFNTFEDIYVPPAPAPEEKK